MVDFLMDQRNGIDSVDDFVDACTKLSVLCMLSFQLEQADHDLEIVPDPVMHLFLENIFLLLVFCDHTITVLERDKHFLFPVIIEL